MSLDCRGDVWLGLENWRSLTLKIQLRLLKVLLGWWGTAHNDKPPTTWLPLSPRQTRGQKPPSWIRAHRSVFNCLFVLCTWQCQFHTDSTLRMSHLTQLFPEAVFSFYVVFKWAGAQEAQQFASWVSVISEAAYSCNLIYLQWKMEVGRSMQVLPWIFPSSLQWTVHSASKLMCYDILFNCTLRSVLQGVHTLEVFLKSISHLLWCFFPS